MKILIVTTSHPYNRAGIVAKDILDGLKARSEIEVKLVVRGWDRYHDKDIIPVESFYEHIFKLIIRKFKGALRRIGVYKPSKIRADKDYIIQDYDQTISYYSTNRVIEKLNGFKPDAIIILFMQNFLSYKNLYELNQLTKAPIFLYMMDMAPMTGGCHYAWDCEGYTKNCGNCPGLFSNNPKDQSFINLEFKGEFVNKTNIVPIAASEWQYKQLLASSLFERKKKYKILLGIDNELFKPLNKMDARKKLKIPSDKKIILFGAVSAHEKRKGFKEFTEALLLLKNILSEKDADNVHIIIVGNGKKEIDNSLTFPHTFLGYLSFMQIATSFQAADVFVNSSIEDSGPMIINQAIMSGTPVVAFEMGVALDLVITGQTGYRAKLKDSSDLAKGMKYILELNDYDYKKMCENCRTLAVELCSPQIQVDRFIRILKNNHVEK